MTLSGTRTFIVGRERAAVIDPGPDDATHLDAVADLIGDGVCVGVLLTHEHPDHAEGADRLARRLGTPVRSLARGSLSEGDAIETDDGALHVLHTPGHTPDHAAFHWADEAAIFCGDLMMGGLDTSLVAPPEGDLGDYLVSLRRLRDLAPRVLHPAHGPSFDDPAAAIAGYIAHREAREEAVLEALRAGARGEDAILDRVYGDTLDPALRGVARGALRAYLEHLRATGRLPEDA